MCSRLLGYCGGSGPLTTKFRHSLVRAPEFLPFTLNSLKVPHKSGKILFLYFSLFKNAPFDFYYMTDDSNVSLN